MSTAGSWIALNQLFVENKTSSSSFTVHPPYSPSRQAFLAPTDYHLFLSLCANLQKEQFENKLSDYCFMTVFRFVDVSLLFFSAQQPMLFQNVLLRFDLITCGPLLTAQENATFVCNFVIICEMFVLCLLATVLLAPRRNAMFDNYRMLKTSLSVHDTEESELGADDNVLESGVSG